MQRIATVSHGWIIASVWIFTNLTGCALSDAGTTDPSGASGGSGGDTSSSSTGSGGMGTGGVAGGGGIGGGGTGGIGGGETGGTGGSGGGSSSSSSSSSSGMPTLENCKDGMDNDDDALVDCRDTDCGSIFSCTAPAPMGWTYVRVRQTAYNAALAPCANGQQPTRLFEGADQGQCNQCSCLASGACEVAMTCYTGDACAAGAVSATYTTNNDGCSADAIAMGGGSCQITNTGTVPANAKCSANGGGLKNVNPFMGEVHTCPVASAGAGCGAEACVLAPSPMYENRLCVSRSGPNACPVGFPEQHLTFASFSDTRACSACTCDKSAITCVGDTTVTLWTNSNCTASAGSITTNNGCQNIGPGITHRNVTKIASMDVPDASCPPSVQQGVVTGQGQTTVCCAAP
ncbi:MAG: hypothetical protein IPM54_03280 [Polyangiaceae bacterium]|nr:hypothetical protein [Polyangiaceae bacterium]